VELLDRLKEVDVEARERVDAGELGMGSLGSVASITDERADDGAALLLDMAAVVLLTSACLSNIDLLTRPTEPH
jgi:hypothetical protein